MLDKVLSYFEGDNLASVVWQDKYALKDSNGNVMEETPTDMHWRMAKEFARVEYDYITVESRRLLDRQEHSALSEFGRKLMLKRVSNCLQDIEQEFFNYFDKFSQIVPQGSIMSNLGNFYVYGSLSNCFGIEPPFDSYSGILKSDEDLAHLMKRRGGVGMHLNNLRYANAPVTNAAKTSTGVVSFAERYSNTTREVAQQGRRGALMLLLSCKHPDIFKFVTMKDDRTKVTGANVSTLLTDEFMKAVEKNDDFLCTFPIDVKYPIVFSDRYGKQTITSVLNPMLHLEYNKITEINCITNEKKIAVMKIHAVELFDLIVDMAWKNAEPGLAYIDRIVDYCPDGVYDMYRPTVCNPCSEQWFAYLETCRLIALCFWAIVKNHFENDAEIDYDLLYELAYMQQRLGDNLVDLEIEYIERIIAKIKSDPEPEHIKRNELELWQGIIKIAREGRRTGSGFTGLGDMLAGINLRYDSPEGIATIEKVMRKKMEAELDCTIDMAILRGSFTGWDNNLEFDIAGDNMNGYVITGGKNSFFDMMLQEFPTQSYRMAIYGRRNVNWSNVAPGGSISLLAQVTSGLEPLFKAYYIRKKKINPSEEGSRVDETDQNGDKWQHYAVLHPKFKQWYDKQNSEDEDSFCYAVDKPRIENCTKETIQYIFENSPWFKSEADDISWEKRIDIQAIIQKYTSNAISSTINLHKDVAQETVKQIYLRAYHKGLKGVTVYRDTSRSGVLVHDVEKTTKDKFGYTDAIKRPVELEAHYYPVKVRGKLFAVIVGLIDNLPYELFAFENPIRDKEITGTLVKVDTGMYTFKSISLTIDNVQLSSDHTDEKLLTRMCSQLLRHGVNPKYIVEQVEKTEVTVVSFAKAIVRILKKYIPDEPTNQVCKVCNEPTVIYEEGCRKCLSCGDSKC